MFRLLTLTALLGLTWIPTTSAAASPFPKHPRHRRRVEDAQGEQDEEEEDISWLANYNVVYEACFHSEQSVAYRLCPRSDDNGQSRNACAVDCAYGGDYLASLVDFVDSFTEAQMEARAYRCEIARENCQYDDDGQCYNTDAYGYDLSYCQNDWQEALDIQEWLECTAIEAEQDNQDGQDGQGDEQDGGQQQGEGQQYYVGPYCGQDNFGIHLGVFTDEDCTQRANDNSAFYDAYGYDLPYSEDSGESLVGSNDGNRVEENANCASCKEHALEEDQNEGDQQDEDDVLEQCEDLYGYTYTKCESDLEIDNNDGAADNGDCEYIEELKESEQVTRTIQNTGGSSGKVKGWLVFVLVALAVGAGVAMYAKHVRKNNNDNDNNKAGSGEKSSTPATSQHGPSNEKLI